MTSREPLLREAVEIARRAREKGNHPFGALLADSSGAVLLTAENTVVTAADPTGHAETNLVRLAGAAYSQAELGEMVLFTSTEPCAMCAGAIFWSGIGLVVYALSEEDFYQISGSDGALMLPCRTVFAAAGRVVAVEGPFDLPEARHVHERFWSAG